MRVLTIASLIATLMAAPALAQVERLPEQSRAERQVEDLNRSMVRQGMQTRQSQQTQFEINQLRGEIQRSQQFPTVIGPGSAVCPPGAVAC
jgi:hypothetical protein